MSFALSPKISRDILLSLIAIVAGIAVIIIPPSVATAIIFVGSLVLLLFATPLTGLMLFLILSPLRTLIATESTIQLPLDIGLISFAIFLIYWAVHRIIQRQAFFDFKWTPLYIPLIGFLFVAGITAFTAISFGSWLNEWLKWVIILMIVYISLSSFDNQSVWKWLVFGLAIAAAANAIIGLYIFFGGSGADHLVISNRFFRAFGTFGQPNPFGGFMGIVAPITIMTTYAQFRLIVLGYFTKRELRYANIGLVILYGGISLLLVAAIFASWSRGAWLSFVVAIGMMAFALPRKLLHSVLLAGTAMLLVLTLWFSGLLPQAIVNRVTSSTEDFFAFDDVRGVDITSENYAVAERLAHWQAALNMVRENPWVGVGLGHYEIVYDEYRLLNWEEALGHAHNYYLNILGETGIIGFIAYCALWISLFAYTWQARQHPDWQARCIIVGLLGSWSYFSVHSLLDNLYVNNLFLHLGVLFSLLAILYRQVNNAVEVKPLWKIPQ